MKRFLLFALPLLLVLFALFSLLLELAGFEPELGPLIGWRAGSYGLPGGWVLATWALESLALAALYLLVERPTAPRFSTGVLVGWIAWVFRGPLLVITAVGFGDLPAAPWWRLTLRWFVLYTLAGLLLGGLGTLLRAPAERPGPSLPPG
ncbi:MAG TPA: hypothetical protein VHM02_15125 [Thermoanaerobaculia bacterium]|nr:hypothetical protein [Thermoanaerobaculia bacterium]